MEARTLEKQIRLEDGSTIRLSRKLGELDMEIALLNADMEAITSFRIPLVAMREGVAAMEAKRPKTRQYGSVKPTCDGCPFMEAGSGCVMPDPRKNCPTYAGKYMEIGVKNYLKWKYGRNDLNENQF